MIDIQFIPEGWRRIDAWMGVGRLGTMLAHDEINIGCTDFDYLDQLIMEGFLAKEYQKYKDAPALIIGTIEEGITHETIHIILIRWGYLLASLALDIVDKGGVISNL